MPSVLVVEDEIAIQRLIEFALKQADFEVQLVDSAEDAQAAIDDRLPDVVLLDWMLPNMSGAQLASQLRATARTKELPIIMLTARGEETDKETGLNLGADDYVTKPFSPRELIARIRALLRRRAPQKSDVMVSVGRLSLNPQECQVTVSDDDGNERVVNFAPAEFKLLHFFMTHPNRIYGRGELLDLVWGDHVFIEERTVDVHIRRLRRQLEQVGVAHYVQTVRGVGYGFGDKAKQGIS